MSAGGGKGLRTGLRTVRALRFFDLDTAGVVVAASASGVDAAAHSASRAADA